LFSHLAFSSEIFFRLHRIRLDSSIHEFRSGWSEKTARPDSASFFVFRKVYGRPDDPYSLGVVTRLPEANLAFLSDLPLSAIRLMM
jgi:hypothetical protein